MVKSGTPEYQRERYKKFRERRLAEKREAYWSDPEKMRARNKAQYDANREKRVQYAREYRRKRREELAAKARERYLAGGEAVKARRRELSKRPEARAKQYAYIRDWLKRNPEKAVLMDAKRLLSEQMEVRIVDIPEDIAEAKAEHLKLVRWIRQQLTHQGNDDD
jgi:hypothetical protein